MGAILTALLPWLWPIYPAPGVFRSKEEARAYHCERALHDAPSYRTLTRIDPPSTRGDGRTSDLVVCTQPMVPPHLRAPADEVVLRTLQQRTQQLAAAAHALRPELQQHTWLVEAHDVSSAVNAKLRFATQAALMEHGLSVSDRTPVLGAGDIQVITRMPPAAAHPAACARYNDTSSLGEDDVLLVIIRPDAHATELAGGLCEQGRWTWL